MEDIIESWIMTAKLLNLKYEIVDHKILVVYNIWSESKDIVILVGKNKIQARYNDRTKSDVRKTDSDEIGTGKVLEEITRWISLL